MPILNKFLLGVIATALLGWFFHAGLGYGNRFVDDLDATSQKAIAQTPNAGGVTARFDREGILARVALLSGPQMNTQARETVRVSVLNATPGLFDARWDKGLIAGTTVLPDNGVLASLASVQACQDRVAASLTKRTIEFVNGSALLVDSSVTLLDGVAASLGPCQNLRVSVIGHTDATGGTARNLRLSEERANVVVEALIARGVPATRVLPSGVGESKPLDPASTPAAYARNRRIEFAVVAKNDPPNP